MKNTLIPLLVFFCLIAKGQKKYSGNYRDNFGNHLVINHDSTFKSVSHYHMISFWISGNCTFNKDTIYFIPKIIHDTILTENEKGVKEQTLIFSNDEIPDFFIDEQIRFSTQNSEYCPKKLFYKDEKLYRIKNGKLLKKG